MTMSSPIKDHKSACAIRRMLNRPSLRTSEHCGSHSMRFQVWDADDRHFLEIVLSRADDHIECAVIDRGRRGVDSQVFRYRNDDLVELERPDRIAIENVGALIRGIALRHERPLDREADTRHALTERLREILETHPEDAAEKIADAISIAADVDKMSDIVEYLANDLVPAVS